jgi:hypothetical protein
MMEFMMGRTSKEEKDEMMGKMMETFFADMTAEDKQKMMEEMMPKMMKECCSGMSEEEKKGFVAKVEGNIKACCGC